MARAAAKDVAVQTVIGPELRAMLVALRLDAVKATHSDGAAFYEGEVESPASARALSVVVHCQGKAGNTAASATATKLIERYSPRFLLLAGIAAGRRDKIDIGDVAIPRAIVDLTSKVARSGKLLGRPRIPSLPYVVSQLLAPFDPNQKGWLDELHRVLGRPLERDVAPKVAEVAIGSDDILLRDPAVLETAAAHVHEHIRIGEMEAAGFTAACELRNPPLPWLVVRAVSDFGDLAKGDAFHELAAASAAAYTATFLRFGFDVRILDPKVPTRRRAAPQPQRRRPDPTGPANSLFASGASGAGTSVFVGRMQLLAQMQTELLLAHGRRRRPIVLEGMAGVGKSYLVMRFIGMHRSNFPGRLISMVLQRDDRRSKDALLGALADNLGVGANEDTRAHLITTGALLHVENVDTDAAAHSVAGLLSELEGCAVLVTGRFQGLGRRAGWSRIEVKPFDESDAMEQLQTEYRPPRDTAEREQFQRLVRVLGGLPYAISLAAGHLCCGHTVQQLLRRFQQKRIGLLDLERADPADRDESRRTLRAMFDLSLQLFEQHLGASGDRLGRAFETLSHAPLSGFGKSLGTAIGGVEDDDFEDLVVAARKLSLLFAVEERGRPEWRFHPLLAAVLRDRPHAVAGFARMSDWFLARLAPVPEAAGDTQGERWQDVLTETAGLDEWLSRLEGEAIVRANNTGTRYAQRFGPFQAWMTLCQRGLAERSDPAERSSLLWTLAHVAQRAGNLDCAMRAAEEKIAIDVGRDECGAARAHGALSDVLVARGEYRRALHYRRKHELPVYLRLAEGARDDDRQRILRWHAIAQGRVAEILVALGKPTLALRLQRDRQIPTLRGIAPTGRLDRRELAIALGQVADTLALLGKPDEALIIMENDVLTACRWLRDPRLEAVSQGKIADLLAARGDLSDAVRIRTEIEIPVYERLGDLREHARARGKLGDLLMRRGMPGDAVAAAAHFAAALGEAGRLSRAERTELQALAERHGCGSTPQSSLS